jgi:phenylalanine-4-hydroxylase
VFGHVPLLINPVFADYMEAYGKGGLKAAGSARSTCWRACTGTPWNSA